MSVFRVLFIKAFQISSNSPSFFQPFRADVTYYYFHETLTSHIRTTRRLLPPVLAVPLPLDRVFRLAQRIHRLHVWCVVRRSCAGAFFCSSLRFCRCRCRFVCLSSPEHQKSGYLSASRAGTDVPNDCGYGSFTPRCNAQVHLDLFVCLCVCLAAPFCLLPFAVDRKWKVATSTFDVCLDASMPRCA